MKKSNSQLGFSPVIIIVTVVVVGLVGLLGYVAYDKFINNNTDNKDSSAIVEQSKTADDMKTVTESAPAAVSKTADLDKALSSLDQITTSQTTEDINLINTQLAEF
jgi:Tfp pilus assembly protein PilE